MQSIKQKYHNLIDEIIFDQAEFSNFLSRAEARPAHKLRVSAISSYFLSSLYYDERVFREGVDLSFTNISRNDKSIIIDHDLGGKKREFDKKLASFSETEIKMMKDTLRKFSAKNSLVDRVTKLFEKKRPLYIESTKELNLRLSQSNRLGDFIKIKSSQPTKKFMKNTLGVGNHVAHNVLVSINNTKTFFPERNNAITKIYNALGVETLPENLQTKFLFLVFKSTSRNSKYRDKDDRLKLYNSLALKNNQVVTLEEMITNSDLKLVSGRSSRDHFRDLNQEIGLQKNYKSGHVEKGYER